MSDTAVDQQLDEAEARPVATSLPRKLALIGLSLILVALLVKVVTIGRAAQSLLSREDEIRTLLDAGLADADPVATEQLVLDVRRDVVVLKAETAPLAAIAPLFGWLPKIGPLLTNAPELLEMADAGSEAAAYAVQGLSPAMTIIQGPNTTGQSKISQVLAVINEAEPNLAKASLAVDRLVEARANMTRVDEFPDRAASLIAQLDAELPMAQDVLYMSLVAPEIMGSEGRRSYLVIAQNEDELRPTGGFISGAGLLVVENGQIVSINFSDANTIDAYYKPGKSYDLPPQPFTDIMGMDIFLFRDANFWPHFPVSAEKAMELYTYGQDVPVDGAIAIDQEFVRLLLRGIGTVFVPELNKNVNGDNVIDEMRAEWGPGNDTSNAWVDERKAFMGPLAAAVQSTLETNIAAVDPVNLLRNIQAAADRRHLQIFMRDPEVAAVLARTGWDGSQNGKLGGDYLLVVDTSLGFNKVSAAVNLHTAYDVVLVDDDSGQATVTLTYQHGIAAESAPEPCKHGTTYFQGIRYEDLINDCYWNYVRVYTPPGSRLVQATNHPLAADFLLSGSPWNGEPRVVTDEPTPYVVFANFLLLAQGQTSISNFTYQLPSGVVQQVDGKNHYILEVHKQAGVRSQPLTITITLPPQARFEQALPAATSVEGQTITFTTDLTQDMTFEVIYD